MKKVKWEKDEKIGTLYKDFGKLILTLSTSTEKGWYRMNIMTNKTYTVAFTANFAAKNEKIAKRKADHDFARLIKSIRRIEK